jgi:hypothetical protein
LAVPRPETDEIAPHLAFFQRLVAMLQKRLADESDPTSRVRRRDVDAAVRQVLATAVDAGEVIDLFQAAGLDAARLDMLSEDFLQRVSALEQKNLALETLRKLLNGSAKEIMKSDTLRLMARELAEMVKRMPKLDWSRRESARADLRRKVRRLLAMYGYPPDLSEDATQLVLKQAALSTENGTE